MLYIGYLFIFVGAVDPLQNAMCIRMTNFRITMFLFIENYIAKKHGPPAADYRQSCIYIYYHLKRRRVVNAGYFFFRPANVVMAHVHLYNL